MTLTEEEKREAGLTEVLPTRASRVGRPTTLSNEEISGDIYVSHRSRREDQGEREGEKESKRMTGSGRSKGRPEVKEIESKWSPTKNLNATQKRLVLARTLEKAVELVMKHHIYWFGQKKPGVRTDAANLGDSPRRETQHPSQP